jgi:hypothetical protein
MRGLFVGEVLFKEEKHERLWPKGHGLLLCCLLSYRHEVQGVGIR